MVLDLEADVRRVDLDFLDGEGEVLQLQAAAGLGLRELGEPGVQTVFGEQRRILGERLALGGGPFVGLELGGRRAGEAAPVLAPTWRQDGRPAERCAGLWFPAARAIRACPAASSPAAGGLRYTARDRGRAVT